jgi:hypothetical protein
MEVFTHINELSQDGWESLRTLVLTAPRVILWCPSASYLSECRQDDFNGWLRPPCVYG